MIANFGMDVVEILISGVSTLGFYLVYKKLGNRKNFLALVGYGAFITMVFFLMPNNPDEPSSSVDLINKFRVTSVVGVSVFWIANAVILGLLWQRYRPDKVRPIELQ